MVKPVSGDSGFVSFGSNNPSKAEAQQAYNNLTQDVKSLSQGKLPSDENQMITDIQTLSNYCQANGVGGMGQGGAMDQLQTALNGIQQADWQGDPASALQMVAQNIQNALSDLNW